MTYRETHLTHIINMMDRAAKQHITHTEQHQDTTNDRQQLVYLARMLIYSL